MSNNNPPHNNSDPGSYTFNTAFTSEEYIERLTTLGNRRINDILRARSWSLSVNVDGHVINSIYTNIQRSTSSIYNSRTRDVYTFLLRCGDFESALSFHDHAPVECWSSHENILQAYYQYRIGKRGDILKINNSSINDVITQLPIRNVGVWKSNSLPGRFISVVKAQHDAISQTGFYPPKCNNCHVRFMRGTGCVLHVYDRRIFPTGNIVNSNIMKIAFKNAENDVKNHVSIQSYQLTPVQLETIRLSLTSTGCEKDFKVWTMILLGGHLFLRASEVCSIEIVDIFLREVEFDYTSPFNVKRFMIQVIRKNKKKYTYQFPVMMPNRS